jgi:hypothetical protein
LPPPPRKTPPKYRLQNDLTPEKKFQVVDIFPPTAPTNENP